MCGTLWCWKHKLEVIVFSTATGSQTHTHKSTYPHPSWCPGQDRHVMTPQLSPTQVYALLLHQANYHLQTPCMVSQFSPQYVHLDSNLFVFTQKCALFDLHGNKWAFSNKWLISSKINNDTFQYNKTCHTDYVFSEYYYTIGPYMYKGLREIRLNVLKDWR